MRKEDIIVSLGVLILIVFIVGGFLTGRGPNIVKAIDKKYSLKFVEGGVKTYNSKDDLNMTVNSISSLKKPYDQKIDSGKSILLYKEAVVIVEEKDGNTEIELIKEHKTAYRRHHNTMVLFWGNNLYRNGRIRTPRSIRKGSIGSSLFRGGGFGFGK